MFQNAIKSALALLVVSLCVSSAAYGDIIASVVGQAGNGLTISDPVGVAITNDDPFAWENVSISVDAGVGSGSFDAYYFDTLDSSFETDPDTVHSVTPAGFATEATIFSNLYIPAETTVYFALTDGVWWGDYYTTPTVTTDPEVTYSYVENDGGTWSTYTPGYNFNFIVTGDMGPAPEPASFVLFGGGLALLAGFTYRRRVANAR